MVIAIRQALDYTSTWRAIGVALIGFIPYIIFTGIVVAIFAIASIWQLVAMVIAIRQALDYTSTWRAIGVALIGFIPYIRIFTGIVVAILRSL